MKFFGIIFPLSLVLSASALAGADLQTLVDRSPFAPPGAAAGAEAPAETGTLEFRGVVVDDRGTSYSVFDASANRGYWVNEGSDGPIQVKSYNEQDNVLEIDQNGRSVKLQLKRATIQTGAPVAVAAPRLANNQNRAQPGAPAANPAADARRLEAVAAEVRRRRALRNAAATQQTPPAPSATPAQ